MCREHNNLKRHVALHFSVREFVCETCGAAFHAKKTLETHRIYKHSQDRAFPCTECPMTFKTLSSVRRHLRIHANSKQHKCSACGIGFNRLYNLRRHMKSVHGTDNTLPPVKRVRLLDAPAGKEYAKGPAALGLQGKPPATRIRLARTQDKPAPVDCQLQTIQQQDIAQMIYQQATVQVGDEHKDVLDLTAQLVTTPQAVTQQTVLHQVAVPATQTYATYQPLTHTYTTQAHNSTGPVIHLTSLQAMQGIFTTGGQTFMTTHALPQAHADPTITDRGEYATDVYAAVPNILNLQLMQGNTQV